MINFLTHWFGREDCSSTADCNKRADEIYSSGYWYGWHIMLAIGIILIITCVVFLFLMDDSTLPWIGVGVSGAMIGMFGYFVWRMRDNANSLRERGEAFKADVVVDKTEKLPVLRVTEMLSGRRKDDKESYIIGRMVQNPEWNTGQTASDYAEYMQLVSLFNNLDKEADSAFDLGEKLDKYDELQGRLLSAIEEGETKKKEVENAVMEKSDTVMEKSVSANDNITETSVSANTETEQLLSNQY